MITTANELKMIWLEVFPDSSAIERFSRILPLQFLVGHLLNEKELSYRNEPLSFMCEVSENGFYKELFCSLNCKSVDKNRPFKIEPIKVVSIKCATYQDIYDRFNTIRTSLVELQNDCNTEIEHKLKLDQIEAM